MDKKSIISTLVGALVGVLSTLGYYEASEPACPEVEVAAEKIESEGLVIEIPEK